MIVHQPGEARESQSPPASFRGVSIAKPIEAAKAAVSVSELAERLSGAAGVRVGREELFLCPLHDDHDPSLRVDLQKKVWYCDPCALGGDVVELARLCWGHPNDGRGAAEAAAYLLLEFGYELPRRPPSWFRKQERQKPVRDAIFEMKFEHLRRRLYRRFCEPAVMAIEDIDERKQEAELLWGATRPLAKMLLADLEDRGAL